MLTDYRNLLPGTATVPRKWRVPRRKLADGRHRQLCNSRSQERSKVTADRFEVYPRCFASIAALSSFFIGCVIFPCRFSCVRVRRSHHQSCSERMCCPEVAPTTHTSNQTDMNRSKRGSVEICFALRWNGMVLAVLVRWGYPTCVPVGKRSRCVRFSGRSRLRPGDTSFGHLENILLNSRRVANLLFVL